MTAPDRVAEASRRQVVLALEGELDVAAAAEAHKDLIAIDLRRGMQLVLDLSRLTFMDSTGIRFLLQARQHAFRHAAALRVVPGPEPVMRVIELVGLGDQLDFVEHPF